MYKKKYSIYWVQYYLWFVPFTIPMGSRGPLYGVPGASVLPACSFPWYTDQPFQGSNWAIKHSEPWCSKHSIFLGSTPMEPADSTHNWRRGFKSRMWLRNQDQEEMTGENRPMAPGKWSEQTSWSLWKQKDNIQMPAGGSWKPLKLSNGVK
jgi:hypothetical protein